MSPTKSTVGDLLTITTGIILHQVNCRGVTGGLAGALRRQWPGQFEIYVKECERMGARMAGTTIIGEAPCQPFIAHVFGQVCPGSNTDVKLVDAALAAAKEGAT